MSHQVAPSAKFLSPAARTGAPREGFGRLSTRIQFGTGGAFAVAPFASLAHKLLCD